MELEKLIRDVPDFPKKGILFKDITTLLQNGEALRQVAGDMAEPYRNQRVDKILAVESRGFIFGGAVAVTLGCGFVPVRKPGKLPWKTIHREYSLEYGTNTLEIHTDAVKRGERVVIVDDLLATGGTVEAVAHMVEELGGKIVGIEFLIELTFLGGREKLNAYPLHAHIRY